MHLFIWAIILAGAGYALTREKKNSSKTTKTLPSSMPSTDKASSISMSTLTKYIKDLMDKGAGAHQVMDDLLSGPVARGAITKLDVLSAFKIVLKLGPDDTKVPAWMLEALAPQRLPADDGTVSD